MAEVVKKRGRILLVASGMQEIGKSFLSLKQMIWQAYSSKHKSKGLIFDSNNEYGNYVIDGKAYKIKEISPNDIIRFSNHTNSEVRRIAPYYKNGAPMTDEDTEQLILKVLYEFRGGGLIVDDLNTIFGDNLPDRVTKALCNVRHKNYDLTLHVQSIGRISTKIRQNAKVVRYHYQLDPVLDSKDKLTGELEIYQIAEKLVNNQFISGNKYFVVYIFRVDKKIKGQFSPKMFSNAIQEYISENTNRLLNPLKAKVNKEGKKMYTHEQALLLKTKEFFIRYYGN